MNLNMNRVSSVLYITITASALYTLCQRPAKLCLGTRLIWNMHMHVDGARPHATYRRAEGCRRLVA